MSAPFSEIPQRADASPWITSSPPRAVAAADWRGAALDDHHARHHVLGHADAAVAVDADGRVLVHAGAVVADVAVDLDLVGTVESDRDRVLAAWVEHAHAAARRRRRRIVQALVQLADAVGREVERQDARLARASGRRHQTTAARCPSCRRAPARAPRAPRPRRRAAPRSRGTRRPSRPTRRSRPSPPACTRSGRAAPRSRRRCRPRTCRSRRGPRGSPRAPARASRPRASARSGSRPRPRCRCRSGSWIPSRLSERRSRLWFESEPLWTRHRSRPVENGCEWSVVTRLSVAIRVCPSACVPAICDSAKRSTN